MNYHANWLPQEQVRWAMDEEDVIIPAAVFKMNGQQFGLETPAKFPMRHRFYASTAPGFDTENYFYYTINRCEDFAEEKEDE
ncbi:MAG: hypothetical protein H0V66_07345 [Bdellovibrionales bacterium]|nr:hypothetical protein [Bdellovibrionales bacterium]